MRIQGKLFSELAEALHSREDQTLTRTDDGSVETSHDVGDVGVTAPGTTKWVSVKARRNDGWLRSSPLKPASDA